MVRLGQSGDEPVSISFSESVAPTEVALAEAVAMEAGREAFRGGASSP